MRRAKPADTSNRIMPGIQCFAWSPDRSMVAVCPQSKEILIFATNQKPDIKDWRLVEVLKEVSVFFDRIARRFHLSQAMIQANRSYTLVLITTYPFLFDFSTTATAAR